MSQKVCAINGHFQQTQKPAKATHLSSTRLAHTHAGVTCQRFQAAVHHTLLFLKLLYPTRCPM